MLIYIKLYILYIQFLLLIELWNNNLNNKRKLYLIVCIKTKYVKYTEKKLKGNCNKNSVPQLLGQVNNNVYCVSTSRGCQTSNHNS